MAGIASLFDRMAVTAQAGILPRLADYDPDLSLEQRLAWQGALLRGADLAWVDEGNRGLLRWLRQHTHGNAPVTPAELEHDFPGLAAWRASSFTP